MPTPTGTISASQIINEFGPNNNTNDLPNRTKMGSYRISQSAGLYSNLPLDAGIPQSGPISFSQLRGKRLNVVVDISGGDEYRVNMRSKYDANAGVAVIGGFKSKPADPSQTNVLISINKKIGSSAGSRQQVALRTGSWGTSTFLTVTLGSSARIIGAGGKGGDFTATTNTTQISVPLYDNEGNQVYYYDPGTDSSYPAYTTEETTTTDFVANNGSTGSSAFGVDYPCTIFNYGYIQNGFGGGGAGGYRSR